MKKRVVMAIFCGVLCLSVPNSAMASQVTQNFNTVGEEIPADEEDILPDEQQESKNPVLEEQVPQLNVLGSYRGAEQLVQQMIDGKKYLVYKDGSHYTGWYKMTETWILYFDPAQDGASATGITEIDEIAYIFNNDGLLCNGGGTPLVNGKKYWTNEDGSVNSGWLNLGNWKMYFDVQTYEAKVGLTNVGDKRYIFDDNGVMQTFAGTPVINGKKYWFSTDGSLQTGWLYLGNWKLYFDENTCEARVGLSEVNGKRYLFDDNGVLCAESGTPVINGKKYWFGADGSLQTGWLNLNGWKLYFDEKTCEARIGLSTVGEKRYLFDNNGVLQAAAGTPVINGKKYWFAEDGSLKTGWLYLGSWKMYFYEDTCEGAVGIAVVDGKQYLFDDNGILMTGSGLVTYSGKKYCFNSDGTVRTGWVQIGNETYYFNPVTGVAATGVTTVDGKKLLFTKEGVKLSGQGMIVIDGKKYYFAGDGSIITGWITLGNWVLYFDPDTGVAATGMTVIDGKQYYFNSDGVRCAGVQYINGKQYYFNSDGTLARNTWIVVNGEKIYVDGQGVGLTDLSYMYPGPYKLVVDRSNCVVTAYAKDASGRYTIPVRSMVCSVGLSDTATPAGTYNTSAKFKLKELMGPSWGKWATRVVGGIYFHSVATGSPSDPTHSVPAGEYNKLGRPASHGCIRLCVRDAKWIYDNCGLGTQVQIGDNYSMPFGKPTLPKISGSVDPTDPAA